jgi:hypothetical protein
MKRLARYLMPFAAAAMLGGCNVTESIKEASVEVDKFHRALDAGNSQGIWASAGADLHQATPRAQFVAVLDAVHRKLGKVKSTKQVGWNSNATTSGSFVTLTNETVFERGTGTEQFVYRKGDADKLSLAGYHIQSNDMMLN